MFQFPPVGTLVEVAFTDGRPDKPFIRQTLAQGNTLPDVKPGEQLQQQREEVSQRVTQAGNWERKTDQAICESSMTREIQADEETRTLVARTTTVQATDKTTVLGTSTLLAGAVQHIAEGDYSVATQGNLVASVGGDATTAVAGSLMEKIGNIRSSIAAVRQDVIAPVVWVGSQQINVMALMLETLEELCRSWRSRPPNIRTATPAGRRTPTLSAQPARSLAS